VSKIERTFERLKSKGQAALICYLMAGDPDLETTEALVIKMAESGADIIELGVPYSDPLADGPTIQAASQRALQKGVNLREVFKLAQRLEGIAAPVVVMTYFNPVFRYGLKAFAEDCQRSAIAGVIIPDLPPEEAGPWMREARKRKLDTIFLAAPTSPPERIKRVSQFSRGFIYYVSLTGVTGVQERLSIELQPAVRRIREQSQKPVAVGFGISTPEQAGEVSRFADGVIMGSAIVKIIEEEPRREALVSRIGIFISSISAAIRREDSR
jgi:tryptophan synthase alpha chain